MCAVAGAATATGLPSFPLHSLIGGEKENKEKQRRKRNFFRERARESKDFWFVLFSSGESVFWPARGYIHSSLLRRRSLNGRPPLSDGPPPPPMPPPPPPPPRTHCRVPYRFLSRNASQSLPLRDRLDPSFTVFLQKEKEPFAGIEQLKTNAWCDRPSLASRPCTLSFLRFPSSLLSSPLLSERVSPTTPNALWTRESARWFRATRDGDSMVNYDSRTRSGRFRPGKCLIW